MSRELHLPGFRFHPTEEELLEFYLKNMIFSKKMSSDIIGCLNIYQFEPWDLPGMAKIGEREWYFLVPRDRKHGSGGGRPNRCTGNGFWKATGSDKKIVSLSSEPKRVVGLRKTLVFYLGRAPRGTKTDWVMNEYRLPDSLSSLPKDIVLCKIYRKATSLKVLEQRAAMEEKTKKAKASPSSSSMDAMSFSSPQQDYTMMPFHDVVLKREEELEENSKEINKGKVLEELQIPKLGMEMEYWNPDNNSFLNSPWFPNFTPNANLFNSYF